MSKKSPTGRRFKFPTADKDALALFRLLADVTDLSDGDDDVDERDVVTRAWLANGCGAGTSPDPGDLVLTSKVLTSETPTSEALTWQALLAQLRLAEATGPLSATTVTRAFARLGLVRRTAKEAQRGCLLFARGKRRVGVRLVHLGNIRAAEIAIGSRKKATKSEKKRRSKRGGIGEPGARLRRGDGGAYVAGTLVDRSTWRDIIESFVATLTRARKALRVAGEGDALPPIPIAFDAFKAFIARGKGADDRKDDAVELAEIGRLQAEIRDLWLARHRAGRAPKGVVLQFDGPDGAGKTSSSKYIPAALLDASAALTAMGATPWTTRTEVFKAPTDADKAAIAADAGAAFGLPTWLARHVVRGMPAVGEILIKDRYQIGDYVYVGAHTAARCTRMAAENARYDAVLAERSILVFQAILFADRKKQAKTFGKRMARGAVADALMLELAARGELTAEAEAELTAVKNKVQVTDFVGMARFGAVLPVYRDFAAAIGAPVIDATDRHAARLDLLERFLAALRMFG